MAGSDKCGESDLRGVQLFTCLPGPREGHSQLFCEGREHSSRLTAAAQAIHAYYFEKNSASAFGLVHVCNCIRKLDSFPAGTNPATFVGSNPTPILPCGSDPHTQPVPIRQSFVGTNPTLARLCGSYPHTQPVPIRRIAAPIRNSS